MYPYSQHKDCYKSRGMAVLTGLLVFEASALGLAGGYFWLLGRPKIEHRLLVRAAARLDLPIDPETASAIMARLSRRERVGVVGSLILSMIILPIWHHWFYQPLLTHPQPVTPLILLTPALTLVFGRLASLTGLMVWDASRGRGPEVRMARAFAPRLTDYVRGREIWTARTIVLVVLPVAAAASWDNRLSAMHLHSATSIIVTVVFLLFFLASAEITSHRLVAVGQPVSSTTDLVWDDGLRSTQLRDLYLTVAFASLYVAVLFLADLPSSYGGVVFLGACALVAFCLAGRPGSYYLRQLWPATQQQVGSAT
jgi:hypothetical protein